MNLSLILLFTGLVASCYGSNILVLAPMGTKSHYNLLDKLSVKLAERGHKVTIIAPFKQSKPVPNLTEVVIENTYNALMKIFVNEHENKDVFGFKMDPWKMVTVMPSMGVKLSEMILEDPVFQKFLKTNQQFDVVISECFLFESVFAGVAAKYKAPLVILAPFMANYWSNYMVGNPSPASFIPNPFLGYTSKMNFLQRLANTLILTFEEIYHHLIYIPKQQEVMNRFFGDQLPPITEIVLNTSLVLVNHHYSLAYSRPYVPNMIEIGGYHVMPPQPLPKDLKQFMDQSKDGVILFSLGSHLKSKDMSEETFNQVTAAFARLKQNVLWKFEDESKKNLPKNVKIMKWLPQSDLLAHPNMKLFVTHGGLLSTIEAVWYGIPVVGIPIMGDQPINMKHTTNAGFGLTVLPEDLTEDNLYNAINEVLTNPKYLENVRRGSEILKDRPMKPMDSAIYWIEYVVRHRGAPHMRSAAQNLKWYQLYMLDVFAVLSAACLLSFYINFVILRFIWRKIFSGKSSKTVIDKKKKRN